ncbi:hypothetical protein [Mesorhizobium sp. M7A.F.Ca.US.005.03.1.1]|uniref:hypothetical protein n=1 Tax=Mesorhizobium sp. M7A.F.Ca.US.005.03.1.1 TaxID=2496736 RepID=UPI0019D10B70|nr:hypothetical protein [Mesorhizobium sp. M7A.F.Ca.US.005.03.1.1]
MIPSKPSDVIESARMFQRRADAHLEDLQATIQATRQKIEESRKVLERLATNGHSTEP